MSPTAEEAPGPGNASSVKGRPWRMMMGDGDLATGPVLIEVGTPVMVRTRYLGSWAAGFEVAGLLDDGYRIRRLSDGSVLSHVLAFEDVRLEVDGSYI